MKFGVPWSKKTVRLEAREAAEDAARRAGMSLDDWLNAVVTKEAGLGGGAAQPAPPASQRIEHNAGPAAYAPPRKRNGQALEPAAAADRRRPLAPPEVQLPPALEKALAEISARQRTLSAKAALPDQSAPQAEPPPVTPPKPATPAAKASAAPEPPPAKTAKAAAPAVPPPSVSPVEPPPAKTAKAAAPAVAPQSEFPVEPPPVMVSPAAVSPAPAAVSPAPAKMPAAELLAAAKTATPDASLSPLKASPAEPEVKAPKSEAPATSTAPPNASLAEPTPPEKPAAPAASAPAAKGPPAEAEPATAEKTLPPAAAMPAKQATAPDRKDAPPAERPPVTNQTPQARPAPSPPAQNLSGLEDQLRNITSQIEALRQPRIEQAINALREELGDIGRALHNAMPREALEVIEAQIQELTGRVAEGRQAGADAGTLARIEYGLSELREALHTLTPAESLVGYREAVAGLAKKIDAIVAEKDPATLQHLQSTILTLRELVTHVASNEAVSRLSGEVQQLAKSVDRIAQAGDGSDALSNLERRIAALSDSLAERAKSGGAVSERLENLVQSLQQKTEQLQQYPATMQELQSAVAALRDVSAHPASNESLSQLTDQVRKLSESIEQMRGALPRANESLDHLTAEVQKLAGDVEQVRNAVPASNESLSHLTEKVQKLADDLGQVRSAVPASNENLSRLTDEVQRLAGNIEEVRRTIPAADDLSNLKHQIAALSDLMSQRADNGDAAAWRLEQSVQSLQEKTEQLPQWPAMMQQLQGEIATLREMAGRTASNESFNHLSGEMQKLAENIDQIRSATPPADALFDLEHRIAAFADTLVEHVRSSSAASSHMEAHVQSLADEIARLQQVLSDNAASAHLENSIARLDAISTALIEHGRSDAISPQLEALVQSLYDKLDLLQHVPGDNVAIAHLEDSIVKLVEKFEATGSRFAKLDAIERGIGDMLLQIEELRAGRTGGVPEGSPAADGLKQDLARTQDALETVHGTLGHVVDRLAMIEQDIRERPRASASASPEMAIMPDDLAVRVVSDAAPLAPAAAPVPQQAPAVAPPQRVPAPSRMAVGSDLLPDHPLEPGAGQPLVHSARVAGSEAALGAARPTSGNASKNNFIAAARRAAQAAAQEQTQSLARGQTAKPSAADTASLGSRLINRVKMLFIAASVIAIVIGSVQTASKFHILDRFKTLGEKAVEVTAAVPDTPATDQPDDTSAPATVTAESDTPPETPPAAASGTSAPAAGVIGSATESTSLLSAPGASPPLDITGSISHSGPDQPAAAPLVSPSPPVAESQLPVAIGGARLRHAASGGDAAAAYEVGTRFIEGRGVPANFEEAARWFERAAAKGLAPAQFRLASMLEKGQGVPKDISRAQQLYLAAANQGNAKAMHNLAVLYAEGVDGKPDYAAAAQWFRKAAERGVADSQFNLGVLAARGLGTDQSLTDSYKWFALAAKQGDKEAAKKRDEVATRLDAKTLAAAQHSVASFVSVKQPADAVSVPAPPGGWDSAAVSPKPKAPATGGVQVGKR